MRFRSSLLALAALAAMNAAWAQEAPPVANMPSSAQGRAASLQHWAVIGDDIAAQVVTALRPDVPVYIKRLPAATPFESGLAEFLETSLYRRGVRVLAKPSAIAYTVNLSTMVATHRSNADTQFFGATTALSTGIMVVREVALESWAAGIAAAGLFVDGARQFVKPSPNARMELAVTTSALVNDEYVLRKTDVYYVDAADAQLYGSAGKTIRIEEGR